MADELRVLLWPYDANLMDACAVSRAVNSVKDNEEGRLRGWTFRHPRPTSARLGDAFAPVSARADAFRDHKLITSALILTRDHLCSRGSSLSFRVAAALRADSLRSAAVRPVLGRLPTRSSAISDM